MPITLTFKNSLCFPQVFLLASLLTYEASRQRYLKPAGEFKASWPPEVHDVKEGKQLSEKQLLHLKIVVP